MQDNTKRRKKVVRVWRRHMAGEKEALEFWQGATENHVVCEELLGEMERRGLRLTNLGNRWIIKALRDKFGERLLHQRCTIQIYRDILPRDTGKGRIRDSGQHLSRIVMKM